MQPLRTDVVAPLNLRLTMAKFGAEYRPDRSNNLRHVYYSRRLNRWFGVSSTPEGNVRINHYAQCPCAART
jgi:hypothetical protein